MELATLIVWSQIDPQIAVGQGSAFVRQAKVQCPQIDIDRGLALVALLQVFLCLFQVQVVDAVQIEVDMFHRRGSVCPIGFAPTFDAETAHSNTS
jgi:hypothetical protein